VKAAELLKQDSVLSEITNNNKLQTKYENSNNSKSSNKC